MAAHFTENDRGATRKLCVHGLAVEIGCDAPSLMSEFERLTAPFVVDDLPTSFATSGSIRPYVEREVLRHLSSSAARMTQTDPCIELYQDGERFWLVDERWGLAEINFLRGQWRSWVLDRARAEPLYQAEGAILWPMAQLLRSRGLHLLPAASVARDGFGTLILSSFDIGPELEIALRGGYRAVGQRWTSVRAEHGRIELLHMPGMVARTQPPRLRGRSAGAAAHWVDVTKHIPLSAQFHAFCDAVLIIEPGRRSDPRISELSVADANDAIRQCWPMADIHPKRRAGSLCSRLGQLCRCVQVQLSRQAGDLLILLDSLRASATMRASVNALAAEKREGDSVAAA